MIGDVRHGTVDEGELRDWARELGVEEHVLQRMVVARRELVEDVAADPRRFGFDLVSPASAAVDVSAELRRRARVQGRLAESFLAGYEPLLRLVPAPPTLPDGTPLDAALERAGRVDADVALELARVVRASVQTRLGRPLDAAAVEHVVREVAWDLDVDVSALLPRVQHVLHEVT